MVGKNPLIYAKFSANATQHSKNKSGHQETTASFQNSVSVPTVLFYGHYDVIAADNEKG